MAEPILRLANVSAGYRKGVHAITGIDLTVDAGDAVGIVGMNGAGKSTLMNAIVGRIRPEVGHVLYDGADVRRLTPDARAGKGLVFLPEGHQVIRTLTVEQNLLLASGRRTTAQARARLNERADLVYGLFPILRERADQLAGLMSGGEQQMLSISRALITGPRLLVLDEPSLGLAPAVVDRIYEALEELRQADLTLVVVEQNDNRLRNVCNRIVVLNEGVVRLACRTDEATPEAVREAYFGGGHSPGTGASPVRHDGGNLA